jgi:hypothetical protein
MVRPRTDIRDAQNALLLSLLLQTGNRLLHFHIGHPVHHILNCYPTATLSCLYFYFLLTCGNTYYLLPGTVNSELALILFFFSRYCPFFKAQELRPSDSRMLVALGESYEKLDKIQVRNEYIYHNFMGQFSDMDIFCSSTYNINSVFLYVLLCNCLRVIKIPTVSLATF